MVRFYNPGAPINDMLSFDNPINDVKQMNLIAKYRLLAEEKSFFEVATEMVIKCDTGDVTVAVKFPDMVEKSYRPHGVVRIDPTRKNITPDVNVAHTEEEAKKKGDKLFFGIMKDRVEAYIANFDYIKSLGMRPKPAQGGDAYALKQLKVKDPADEISNVIESNQNVASMTAMQAQIDKLTALLEKR